MTTPPPWSSPINHAECLDPRCGWTYTGRRALSYGEQHSAEFDHDVDVSSTRRIRFHCGDPVRIVPVYVEDPTMLRAGDDDDD